MISCLKYACIAVLIAGAPGLSFAQGEGLGNKNIPTVNELVEKYKGKNIPEKRRAITYLASHTPPARPDLIIKALNDDNEDIRREAILVLDYYVKAKLLNEEHIDALEIAIKREIYSVNRYNPKILFLIRAAYATESSRVPDILVDLLVATTTMKAPASNNTFWRLYRIFEAINTPAIAEKLIARIKSNIYGDEQVEKLARALVIYKDEKTVNTLIELFKSHKSQEVRSVALYSLRTINNSKAIKPILENLFKKEYQDVFGSMIFALQSMQQPELLDAVIEHLDEKKLASKVDAKELLVYRIHLLSIFTSRYEKAVPVIMKLAKHDKNVCVRHGAIGVLGRVGAPETVDFLLDTAKKHKSQDFRIRALQSLVPLKDARVTDFFYDALKNTQDETLNFYATMHLRGNPVPEGETLLIKVLKDSKSRDVRWNAALALSKYNTPETFDALYNTFLNDELMVWDAAKHSLYGIDKKKLILKMKELQKTASSDELKKRIMSVLDDKNRGYHFSFGDPVLHGEGDVARQCRELVQKSDVQAVIRIREPSYTFKPGK